MRGTTLFCTDTCWNGVGDRLLDIDPSLEVVLLTGDEPVSEADIERITIAFHSSDVWESRMKPFFGVIKRTTNLTWFQTSAAGTDRAAFAQIRERGATLTSAVGAAAPSIAHTVMLYLIALSRDLPNLAREQADRVWKPRNSVDLEGLKLGIVGLGAIGSEVARLGAAFGMDVVGMRRSVRGDEVCTTWTNDRLHELLAWADAVAVTAPLTDETRGMLGAGEFATMRPGSWFVNVGRGEVVDEDALVASLQSGHIGGAGLDVFAIEPLPAESPLWSMPNVIITPHSSGLTPDARRRTTEIFVDNFRRYTAGQPLVNVA